MKISDGEKLIIKMLADLMIHNKVESDLDPLYISEAISGGHHWALENKYPWLLAEEDDTEKDYKETRDILSMWRALENTYEKLDNGQRKELATKAHLSDKGVKFDGFDGNNEIEHRGIALFMIEKQEWYTEFKGRGLNSHSIRLPKYRSMLKEFLPIMRSLVSDGSNLTVDEMAQVLSVKVL